MEYHFIKECGDFVITVATTETLKVGEVIRVGKLLYEITHVGRKVYNIKNGISTEEDCIVMCKEITPMDLHRENQQMKNRSVKKLPRLPDWLFEE